MAIEARATTMMKPRSTTHMEATNSRLRATDPSLVTDTRLQVIVPCLLAISDTSKGWVRPSLRGISRTALSENSFSTEYVVTTCRTGTTFASPESNALDHPTTLLRTPTSADISSKNT